MKELLDIHALADGELSKEESQALRKLIASNPAVEAEFSSISNFVDFVSSNAARHQADDCWKACVIRLNELDRSKKVEGFMGRYAWAMCATLFALIIGGRYAVKDVRGESARSADLIRIFRSAPKDQSQNQQLYAHLFEGSKQARSGLRIREHATGSILDVPVDRFTIQDRKGDLTYFIIQDIVNFEDATEVTSGSGIFGGMISSPDSQGAPGLNCVIWTDQGQTRVLLGPRSISELADCTIQLGLKSTLN